MASMCSSVWSALADRFSAVASEGEFDFWFFSIANHHLPKGLKNGSILYHSAEVQVQQRSGFPAAVIAGAEMFTGDEFLRLNRFLWLSWVSGRLLAPAADQPDLDWLLTVHDKARERVERVGDEAVVRRLIEASASTARQIAEERGEGGRSPKTDALLLQPGAWQRPLLTLRDSFRQYVGTKFDLHLELHGFTRPGIAGNGEQEVDRAQLYAMASGRAVNTHKSQPLIYWMDTQPGEQFVQFAEHAGRQLPTSLIPSIRLLPTGASQFGRARRPDPLVTWMEFLWPANPTNYRRCTDSSDPGARKGVWHGGNPFLASVLAIDHFIEGYSMETLGDFNRRVVEVCPWFRADDRPAVLAAIETAFRTPTPDPIQTLRSERSDRPGIATLGDLLAAVHGVEEAATDWRAEATRRGSEIGSEYYRIQAGVFEATAEYKQHPMYPHLEAYVNQRYGVFTYGNLLRLRGDVAHLQNCGSTEADRLPLEEVAAVLGCPGVPQVASVEPSSTSPPAPHADANEADLANPRRYALGELIQWLDGIEHNRRFHRLNQKEQLRRNPISAAMNAVYSSALRWRPDENEMPGIGRIEVLCDLEAGEAGITAAKVRRLRARICQQHHWEPSMADRLNLTEAADMLQGMQRVSLNQLQRASQNTFHDGLCTLDHVNLGTGERVQVTGLSCKVIAGTTPTACPDARPALPPSFLPDAETAIRRLNKLPPGTTIHWVGHDTGYRSRCRCHPNAPFAAPFDQHRWASVAGGNSPVGSAATPLAPMLLADVAARLAREAPGAGDGGPKRDEAESPVEQEPKVERDGSVKDVVDDLNSEHGKTRDRIPWDEANLLVRNYLEGLRLKPGDSMPTVRETNAATRVSIGQISKLPSYQAKRAELGAPVQPPKRHRAERRLGRVLLESVGQTDDALETISSLERAEREYMESATDQERAEFHKMPPDKRREMLQTIADQIADDSDDD